MTEEEQQNTESSEVQKGTEEKLSLPQFGDFEAFGDVDLEVTAVLGCASMPISQFLKLGRGAVIELDHSKNDDVDIYVNGSFVAQGEITLVEDKIGLTVTDVGAKPDKKKK